MKRFEYFHKPVEDMDLLQHPKRKEEVVKMLLKMMDEMGYSQSMNTLVQESQVRQEEDPFNNLSACISEGNWVKALEIIEKSPLNEYQQRRANLLINEQMYIELITNHRHNEALSLLRNICVQNHEESERLEKLATILVCKTPQEIEHKLEKTTDISIARQSLLHTLKEECQIKQMFPNLRMKELLHQALSFQFHECRFHEPDLSSVGLLEDHACIVEEYPTKAHLRSFENYDEIAIVKFSNLGDHFATVTKNQELCVWRLCVDKIVPNLKYKIDQAHEGTINCVTWSMDDTSILTASSDRKIKMWDAEDGHIRFTLNGHQSAVSSVIWIPGTENFLSGGHDKYLLLWDDEGEELARISSTKVAQLLTSSDGRQIFVVSAFEPKIFVIDALTQKEAKQIKEKAPILEASISKDNLYLLTHISYNTSELHLWNLEKSEIVQVFSNNIGQSGKLGCSFGGLKSQFIVCGDGEGKIKIWHRNKPEPLTILQNNNSKVNSISWHPSNQNILLSASEDCTLCLWVSDKLQDHLANGLKEVNRV